MLSFFFFHLYAISWLSELDIGNFLFWLFKKEGCFVAYCVLKRENAVLLFRWLLGLVGDIERTW